MFNISDKVVCIDDSPPRVTSLPNSLKKGMIYVVRGGREMVDGWGIFLVGINGETIPGFGESGWCPHRFRKLDDIKEANRIRASAEAKEADQEHRRNIASWAEQINAFYRQANHNRP